MREFILQELMQLTVINNNILLEYVDFCIENNIGHQIPRKSAIHHILPRAKRLPFQKYENLKEHPWNKTILTNYNHYYAHYLLAKSISHISISHSFCAMHKKDLINGRLDKIDLIPEIEFNKIYEERNQQSSKYLKEMIKVNDVIMSRGTYNNLRYPRPKHVIEKMSLKMKGNNNIIHLPGVIERIRKTKICNNLDIAGAEKAAITMKKEYITKDGKITTIYKENAKKISKTVTQEYTDQNGNITTIALERGKSKRLQMIKNGKWYVIRNVFDANIEMILPSAYVRKISPGLYTKTKENYLGMSAYGKNIFLKQDKKFLIGLYSEMLSEAPLYYNFDRDYTPYL